jgi:tRNA (adenine22-N1)-methyltransferase
MAEHPTSLIHFVDVMPHLIDGVEERLNALSLLPAPHRNWAVHCMDGAAIKLDSHQSHLVIIAGVGGDLLIEMVQAIMAKHSSLMANNRLDFILCPVRQLHKVRQGLDTLKLGLISEQIVKDNRQFYEVIQVSNRSKIKVSLAGQQMWNLCNEQHLAYRKTMIDHYQKQPSDQARHLLALYQNIN